MSLAGQLTSGYELGSFYDEMYLAPGRPRPHYRVLEAFLGIV